jgi:hypothetical protein
LPGNEWARQIVYNVLLQSRARLQAPRFCGEKSSQRRLREQDGRNGFQGKGDAAPEDSTLSGWAGCNSGYRKLSSLQMFLYEINQHRMAADLSAQKDQARIQDER